MAYTLTNYKGMQVPDSTPGVGGDAIKDNFTELADRIGPCNVATAAPTTGDDSGDGYEVGSRWYDTANDIEYVCLDNTTGAAVWQATTNVLTAARLADGIVTAAKLNADTAGGGLSQDGTGALQIDAAAAGTGLEVSGTAMRIATTAAGDGLAGGGGSALSLADGGVTADKLGYADDATVVVQQGATATANGTNLLAAYAAAKLLTPGGSALAADNRAAVIVPPGKYDLGGSYLTMNAEYVDVVGVGPARFNMGVLGGDPWQDGAPTDATISIDAFTTPLSHVVSLSADYALYISAADVRVMNLHIEHTAGDSGSIACYIGAASSADSVFADLVVESNIHCIVGGEDATFHQVHCTYAFLGEFTCGASGTFIDCTGGNGSFGGYQTASGYFERCFTCGDGGYGGYGGTASGTFVDCIGGDVSFGYNTTGTFIRCVGGMDAFGGGLNTSGTFIDCIGGSYSFAGTASGTFLRCTAGISSFGDTAASGTFTDCVAGDGSFGGYSGAVSGVFTRCVGEGNCWSGVTADPSTLNAVLRQCVNVGRSQQIYKFQGLMIDCEFHTTTGDGVQLTPATYGTGAVTCITASTTSKAIVVGSVASDFPVGAMIYNTTDATWHRITVVTETGGNTEIDISPTATTEFDGMSIQAYGVPRIINSTIIAAGASIKGSAATPAVIVNLRSNAAIDPNVTNVVSTPNNVIDEHLWTLYI